LQGHILSSVGDAVTLKMWETAPKCGAICCFVSWFVIKIFGEMLNTPMKVNGGRLWWILVPHDRSGELQEWDLLLFGCSFWTLIWWCSTLNSEITKDAESCQEWDLLPLLILDYYIMTFSIPILQNNFKQRWVPPPNTNPLLPL
jgi:hypothetical protein